MNFKKSFFTYSYRIMFGVLIIISSQELLLAQHPGGVSGNLQLWLRADQGTNTTTEGQNVLMWNDQSSSGFNAAADENATDYPTYLLNSLNFNPGILFDGTYTDAYSDGLHLGSNYITSDSLALNFFIVCKPNTGGGTRDFLFDFGDFLSHGYGFSYSDEYYGLYVLGSGQNFSSQYQDDKGVILRFDYDHDLPTYNTRIHQNGVQAIQHSSVANTITLNDIDEIDFYSDDPANVQSGPFSIGRASSYDNLTMQGSNNVFNGSILEIIAYNNRDLSTTETHQINSYLAMKYGITLPHNYIDCNENTIKDVSTFNHNIAAVGRYDCSGYYQKQSKSIEEDAILTIAVDTLTATNELNPAVISDQSCAIWGHNDAPINDWQSNIVTIGGTRFAIQNRVWNMKPVDGSFPNFLHHFEVENPIYDIPDIPSYSDGSYYLIFSFTNNFINPDGALIMTDEGADIWKFALSSLSLENYFTIGVLIPEEDCSNYIDDDGDGLIDCNDSACPCCGAQAPLLQKN